MKISLILKLPQVSENTSDINKLVELYKNLSIEQSIVQMRTDGLADAEIRATLASQNYAESDIEQTLAIKSSNDAIQTNTTLTKANTAMKKIGTIATGIFNAALTAGVSVIVTMMATGSLSLFSFSM